MSLQTGPSSKLPNQKFLATLSFLWKYFWGKSLLWTATNNDGFMFSSEIAIIMIVPQQRRSQKWKFSSEGSAKLCNAWGWCWSKQLVMWLNSWKSCSNIAQEKRFILSTFIINNNCSQEWRLPAKLKYSNIFHLPSQQHQIEIQSSTDFSPNWISRL